MSFIDHRSIHKNVEIFEILVDFMNNYKYHHHLEDCGCDEEDRFDENGENDGHLHYRTCFRKDCNSNDDEVYYNDSVSGGNREDNNHDFNQYEMLFKIALVYGREKTMQFVLNNK